MAEVTLDFLGRQNERILRELANLKDAVDVLTAMSIRHEGSIQTVVQEVQALHRQWSRMNDRVSKLEDERTS